MLYFLVLINKELYFFMKNNLLKIAYYIKSPYICTRKY